MTEQVTGKAIRPPLPRGQQALVLLVGVATFLVLGAALGPYPDLLSEEGRRMGELRWYWEALKPLVPVGLAVLVGLTAARLLGRAMRAEKA